MIRALLLLSLSCFSIDARAQVSGTGSTFFKQPAGCASTTNANCSLAATASGQADGACVSGYTGACTFHCFRGTWTSQANSCVPGNCPTTTISSCDLTSTAPGGSGGACASGHTGTCDYSCSSGTWTQSSNTCALAAATQDFTTAGTHTWVKPSSGTTANIKCWGGGGSGGRNSGGNEGGGAGGGGYATVNIALSSLPAQVTVTVGAGGPAHAAQSVGTAGGASSFGSYATANGGGGGGWPGAGGGGGWTASGGTGENGGNGSAGGSSTAGQSRTNAGAGGGGGANSSPPGGGSSTNGGDGGAGTRSGTAGSGGFPGGGGGGAKDGTSGAGGGGRCIITVT